MNPLPGGEIVPALDRGLIDAAEFNNASSDRVLGFPDVAKNCMLQSFHQSGELGHQSAIDRHTIEDDVMQRQVEPVLILRELPRYWQLPRPKLRAKSWR